MKYKFEKKPPQLIACQNYKESNKEVVVKEL